MEWLLSTISRDDEAERRRMNIICRTRTLFTGHNYILRAVMLLRRWTTVHRCQKCGFVFALPHLQRRWQTMRTDNVPFRAITNGAITLYYTYTLDCFQRTSSLTNCVKGKDREIKRVSESVFDSPGQ